MTLNNVRRDLLLNLGVVAGGSLLPSSTPSLAGVHPETPVPGTYTAPAARWQPLVPQMFDATGDGQYRPLSSRFKSLAEAQRRFPFVTSLQQSQDWAGLQAALNVAEPVAGKVLVPTGRYIITDTLRIPNCVTLEGESRWGSVIDNQNLRLAAPQLTNKDPAAFVYATIRNLTLNGGTHALSVKATREVAGLVIEGVSAHLQTVANFEFSSVQTTVIRDCHLIGGRFGISVTGFPCNSVHLFNTRLGEHSDASIRLRSADLLVMLGGSIEAGGREGPATIDIETGGLYANAVAFRHVYFESTHPVLLRSRGSSGISFDGCKFTGTGVGAAAFRPYRFDCADDVITFGANYFQQATIAPARAVMIGSNPNLHPARTAR